MAFEFLLLAFIDGQAPITVKKYETLSVCQENARQVTEYVQNNYTELKNADDLEKLIVLGLLAEFNETWEMVKLPVPSVADTESASNLWAKKLLVDAEATRLKGIEFGSLELLEDVVVLKFELQKYIENSELPSQPNGEQPNFTVNRTGVRYSCLAVPD